MSRRRTSISFVYLDNDAVNDIVSGEPSAKAVATKRFWRRILSSSSYRPVISSYVVEEAQRGEGAYARLVLCKRIKELGPHPDIPAMGHDLRKHMHWTGVKLMDAIHIACAAHYGVQYLVTWDNKLCNSYKFEKSRAAMTDYFFKFGLVPPVILKPDAFIDATNPKRKVRDIPSAGQLLSRKIRRNLFKLAGGDVQKALRILRSPVKYPLV